MSSFGPEPKRKDGIASACVLCARTVKRDAMRKARSLDPRKYTAIAREQRRRARERDEAAYLAANAERQRRRRLKDAPRVRSEDRGLYRRNSEARKERQRRQIHKNPERYASDQRRWRKARIARSVELHRQKSNVYDQARRARELKAPGRGVSKREWLNLIGLVGARCEYCNRSCSPTMDHIEPLFAGGAHDIENIAVACGRCNKSKRDIPLLVWLTKSKQRNLYRAAA